MAHVEAPVETNTSISLKCRHESERGWTTNTYLPVAAHVAVMTASPVRFDAHAGLPANELTFPTLISAPRSLSRTDEDQSLFWWISTEAILVADSRSKLNHSFALLHSVWKLAFCSPSTAKEAGPPQASTTEDADTGHGLLPPPPHPLALLKNEYPVAPENLPASQSVQTVDAVPAEYFPAPHNVQEALPLLLLYVP